MQRIIVFHRKVSTWTNVHPGWNMYMYCEAVIMY
ncbi:hypothetical protein LSH36_237g03029 [Paralvinella palmiformis]|uniref:Uncharacterized protein n=1 Tax=Paralvinella palmiformis TaxID=53620 RepID=A0AAD9JLQ8_9ANNE|nr:hypothetical protein LSH36_237g03029 [Paralvinella palmiformis]